VLQPLGEPAYATDTGMHGAQARSSRWSGEEWARSLGGIEYDDNEPHGRLDRPSPVTRYLE
jgi:hypothetical protein